MKASLRFQLWLIRTKFKLLTAISKKKAAKAAFRLFCTPRSRHKVDLPAIFGDAEPLSFSHRGIIVRGWRWNNGGHKKALVIHGFESSVTNFDRYIPAFITKGYEVLAFDAPAHGRSDGKRINAPSYRDMILEADRQFGPIDSFLAHSFGGLALALAMEDISDQLSRRIVLIAPATETPTAINDFFRLLKLPPFLLPYFDQCIIDAAGPPASWYSITRAAENITSEILWIHDEDDDTTPLKDLDTIRGKNYPNIRFVITKGLGHRRIYRDKQVIALVTEFI